MSEYSSILYKADKRVSESIGKTEKFFTLEKAFGNLHHVNDIFLAPGEKTTYSNSEITNVLIPITGGLSYQNGLPENKFINSEEILFLGTEKENHVVKNPFEKETINFLNLGLSKTNYSKKTGSYAIDLNEFNKLTSLHLNIIDADAYAGLGVFKGRTKGSYTLKDTKNGIFAYIINGAFEVEERLLEHRDGLALWNTKKIEFEALSEFAILLIIEIPLISN